MSNVSRPMGLIPFGPLYRGSGVLLHITSLSSPYGIGDVGPAAFAMVDRLRGAGPGLVAGTPTRSCGLR